MSGHLDARKLLACMETLRVAGNTLTPDQLSGPEEWKTLAASHYNLGFLDCVLEVNKWITAQLEDIE
jgi:hypothetical protein